MIRLAAVDMQSLPPLAEGERWVIAAQATLEKLTIRAPISGTVLQVNGKPGDDTTHGL
jgi:multidrug resistance efflux pump